MKKWIPVTLLLLILLGCHNKPEEAVVAKELDHGLVNFAAIVILDDLITNGAKSDFVSISPVPIVNPDTTVTAQAILDEFSNDFAGSVNEYPKKLSDGIFITWNLEQDAEAQSELAFHVESRDKNEAFFGKLALRFDPEFYSAIPYPTYSSGSGVTVICHEFSSALQRRNDFLLWIEVSLDKCLEATDYYASVRNQLGQQQSLLAERLLHIYTGNEPVSGSLAQKLASYYQAGSAFAPDSVCLTGSREECLANLKTEIIRKHADLEADDIEEITIHIESPESGSSPSTQQKPAYGKPGAPAQPVSPPRETSAPATLGSRPDDMKSTPGMGPDMTVPAARQTAEGEQAPEKTKENRLPDGSAPSSGAP